MESKKINQLATELAPDLSDLTIIGDPTTGISKKITLSQMASLFTGTVEEYANLAAFPLVGVADTIYIALDTNILYRWNTGTSAYVELSPNIVSSLVFNDANGFDGTISLVGSVATLTITTALTTGSVGFIGASGALLQDNANFFWDDTNNRLGLGTNVPTTALDAFGSGIIGRLNGTSTNNAYLGFASAGTNKWSVGNVQSDHRFRIFSEANSAELITILQTGEFGIGIANPLTKLHIDGGATALIANLDANVSVAKSLSFRSDNSNRINLEVSGTESGTNAGADFFLRAYSDAGALLSTPLTITRATGAAAFSNSVTFAASVINFVGSSKLISGNGSTINYLYSGTTSLSIQNQADTTTIASISNTGVATFIGSVTATQGNFFQTAASGLAINLKNRNANQQYGFVVDVNAVDDKSFGLFDVTNSLYRLVVTNAGNVGIGTSSPVGKLDISTGGNRNVVISNDDTDTGYNIVSLNGTRTKGSYVGLAGGGTGDNNLYINSALDISLQTGASFTQRMRITSTGLVGIGQTPNADCRFNVRGVDSTSSNIALYVSNTNVDNLFYIRNDGLILTGAAAASPYNNTTASAVNMHVGTSGILYRSTSSIRFKTQIEDLTIDTSNILSKMRPIWYRSLSKDDKKDWSWYGFIAEELAEIEPRLVQWGYDENSYESIEIQDEEGNIKQETKLKENAVLIPDGVQYERITVFLVAELQKMRKELDTLKAK